MLSETDLRAAIDRSERRRRSFSDEEALRILFTARMGAKRASVLLTEVGNTFRATEQPALTVRFVIADIIETVYGAPERLKYVQAVVLGSAQ